jgi:hypothetical protein
MQTGTTYDNFEDACTSIAIPETRGVTQTLLAVHNTDNYVIVNGLEVEPIAMGGKTTLHDVALLEHVVHRATAVCKSRVGICVEAIKNIQACLRANNFGPIEGNSASAPFAEVALRASTFTTSCSRVFYALAAHAYLLYQMLDNCGWTESICGQKCSLAERMSGDIEFGISQGGTAAEIAEEQANLHHGEAYMDQEIAFPHTREETPAHERAEAPANLPTPPVGEPAPRSPGDSTLPPLPAYPPPRRSPAYERADVSAANLQAAWNPALGSQILPTAPAPGNLAPHDPSPPTRSAARERSETWRIGMRIISKSFLR